jgi:GINS complex subunit 1
MDVDIGASLLPPKQVFTEVRVLRDCGEIMSDHGPVNLAQNTQHYLRKSDVQELINSGAIQAIN